MKRPVVQFRFNKTFPTLFPQGGPSERRVIANDNWVTSGASFAGRADPVAPNSPDPGNDHENRTHALDMPMERIPSIDANPDVDGRVDVAVGLPDRAQARDRGTPRPMRGL
jgi:hypothetical protein